MRVTKWDEQLNDWVEIFEDIPYLRIQSANVHVDLVPTEEGLQIKSRANEINIKVNTDDSVIIST